MSSPFPRWQIWAVHSTRNGVPPELQPGYEPPVPPVEEPAAEDVPRETPPEEAPPPAAAKKKR